MGSREEIFEKLRRNTREVHEYPDLSPLEREALVHEDKIAAFAESLRAAGGKAVSAPEGEEDVRAFIARTIHEEYPEAHTMVSAIGELPGVPAAAPETFASPSDLDGTDVAVVRGRLGVAENGAVWIDECGRHRALLFIAEALVIVLDRNSVVDNMHQAYAALEEAEVPSFGTFISGPSKTADIEQALVFGAHGASSVVVVLV